MPSKKSRRSITIPRLDVQVRGVDASVVRTAMDRLPSQLSAALARDSAGAATVDDSTVRVPRGVDGEALSMALAERLAPIVRQRLPRNGGA